MDEQRLKAIEKVQHSVARMQKVDPNALPRIDKLGESFAFTAAVAPAAAIIDLYKQINLDSLRHLNASRADSLTRRADADFSRINDILNFDPAKQNNPVVQRDNMVAALHQEYENAFEAIYPLAAYLSTRTIDFAKIGNEARATMQRIQDETEQTTRQIVAKAEEAEKALQSIREVAAEQGVSQQAIYFANEADIHEKSASKWLLATQILTGSLALASAGMLFVHKIPFLAPATAYEAVQLSIGKVFFLAILGSLVILSTKNYFSHRHNAVINRHRRNALVTYRALVEAGGDSANRDIVLAAAASCIFADQPTGFSRTDTSQDGGSHPPLITISNPVMRHISQPD